MKYLRIIDELFSSDSVLFLALGLVFAFALGLILKSPRKSGIGMLVSFVVYAICEVLENLSTSYLLSFIALFLGTAAIGCFIGFLLTFIIMKLRKD